MKKQGYKRLSFDDRKVIEIMLKKGHSVSEIAKALNKSHPAIYHELKRCKGLERYNADFAQQDYLKCNKDNGREAKLELDNELAKYISKMILEESLSPVEIINRLRSENYPNFPSSKTTIYAAIDNGLIPSVTRKTLLSKRKKTHMFSNGLIKIPKWICDELSLKDNEDLEIDIVHDKIIIKRASNN